MTRKMDNVEDNVGEYTRSNESILSVWTFWKKRRYVVAIWTFLGFFTSYALRVNLSIAIVAMTEYKNVTLDNGTVIWSREFDWDTKLQGYILSSFFYGYITTQILGGYLAAIYGGKKVFGAGIAVTALLTLVTPWVARMNIYVLLSVRVIEGIFEGLAYPCVHAIWGKWAPPLERSRLVAISFSGSYVGTVVAMPLCSLLASSLGWESIFYFFGALGLFWCLLWLMIVPDSPEDDEKMTVEELDYIVNSIETKMKKNMDVPWGSIVTSMPVWALTVSHFCENWGFYTLLTQLPKFMSRIMNFDLNAAGITSALPYLLVGVLTQFSGHTADWFIGKRIMTVTQVRRVFNCGGFLFQTIFLLGSIYWLSPVGTTFCISMAVGLGAFSWAGFSINHLDIAPQYASILLGFGNTFATIPGMISPILTGYIVTDEAKIDQWRIVFFIASGIYLFGAVFYGIFVSGKLQPWAMDNYAEQNKPKSKTIPQT